jgi:hypothetical protein
MEKAHMEVRPSFVYRDLNSKPVTHFEWVYKDERMKVYSEPLYSGHGKRLLAIYLTSYQVLERNNVYGT